MTSSVAAPAKVNLTLHITGQRADGYHLLDSLVTFVDVADVLTFHAGSALSITTSGPFAEGVPLDHRNLVWQAAEIAGWTGHIHLEKNLPHGAGIGGGSSDAAAVLRMFGGADRALELGADVPVCLGTTPQRMRGIGERCSFLPEIPALEVVLVNPRVHVPTPAIFKALVQKDNPPMPEEIPPFLTGSDLIAWLATQRNDLQAAAIAAAPVIRDVLDSLGAAELARMSGSGATCFGLFTDASQAAQMAAQIQTAHPDWWVARGTTLHMV